MRGTSWANSAALPSTQQERRRRLAVPAVVRPPSGRTGQRLKCILGYVRRGSKRLSTLRTGLLLTYATWRTRVVCGATPLRTADRARASRASPHGQGGPRYTMQRSLATRGESQSCWGYGTATSHPLPCHAPRWCAARAGWRRPQAAGRPGADSVPSCAQRGQSGARERRALQRRPELSAPPCRPPRPAPSDCCGCRASRPGGWCTALADYDGC
jgi:hypothetical protein